MGIAASQPPQSQLRAGDAATSTRGSSARTPRGGLGVHTLQRHALRDPLQRSASGPAPIQRVGDGEVVNLRKLEGDIGTAIDRSDLQKAEFVAGDPAFVGNEVQVPAASLTSVQVTALEAACRRYLKLFSDVRTSAEFTDFKAKFVTGPLGKVYQTFDVDNKAVKDNLAVANSTELDDDSKVVTRVNAAKTALHNLVGLAVAKLGTDLRTEFTNGGNDIRNRGAGAEVTAVDNMLALQVIVPDKVTGVYKSEHDVAAGSMGAEWGMRSGGATTHVGGAAEATRLAREWVLHAHVSNAVAGKYDKKVTSLSADHFHLKDKATAGGGDGPSVIVGTARVKAPAEQVLIAHINKQTSRKRQDWIADGYMTIPA